MKPTKENIDILKKLGFSCVMKRTKNPADEEWYELSNGWGFALYAVPNFEILLKNLEKSCYNDGYDDCSENKKRRFGTPLDR